MSVDIQDAYFLDPIAESPKKFSKSSINRKIYKSSCLPFGFLLASYVFTKILKSVVEYLSTRGIKSVVYLNDFLLIAYMEQQCKKHSELTIELLKSLGFGIDIKKGQSTPSAICIFLGFKVNSEENG